MDSDQRKNDIIANTKKKIAYLQMLLTLADRMTYYTTLLKPLTITVLCYGVFNFIKDLDKVNNTNISDFNPSILITILVTMVIMLFDGYYLDLSRWYRNLFNEVRKLNENKISFLWEFEGKYNYNTNIYDFQELKPNYFNCLFSKSIISFYFPVLIVEIVLFVCFGGIDFISNTISSRMFYLIVLLIVLIIILIFYIFRRHNKYILKTNNKTIFMDGGKEDVYQPDENQLSKRFNDANFNATLKWEEDIEKESFWKRLKSIKFKSLLDLDSFFELFQIQHIDCDLSVLLCNNNNKLYNNNINDSLVYFNNQMYRNYAIYLTDDQVKGDEDTYENIYVNLDKLPKDVYKLVFVVNIYDADKKNQDFSMLSEAFLSITNDKNIELCRFDLKDNEDVNNYSGIIAAEIVRGDNSWEFIPKGEGVVAPRLECILKKYE